MGCRSGISVRVVAHCVRLRLKEKFRMETRKC